MKKQEKKNMEIKTFKVAPTFSKKNTAPFPPPPPPKKNRNSIPGISMSSHKLNHFTDNK